jgi:threonine/homoserine/homoserine lactone efflux protein
VLSISFLVIATVLHGAYAILAARLRPWLRSRRRARLRNRLTGSCLIAAALGLALARRQ